MRILDYTDVGVVLAGSTALTMIQHSIDPSAPEMDAKTLLAIATTIGTVFGGIVLAFRKLVPIVRDSIKPLEMQLITSGNDENTFRSMLESELRAIRDRLDTSNEIQSKRLMMLEDRVTTTERDVKGILLER